MTLSEILLTLVILAGIIGALCHSAYEAGREKGRSEGLSEAKRLTWAALRATVQDSSTPEARSAAWSVARLFTESLPPQS